MSKPQVAKEHYDFECYGHLDRWVSYYMQLRETFRFKPKSVLEIGVGDKVFGDYLRNNTGISYTSVDIAEDLRPNVIGSVTELPFQNRSFDVVVAFEVLEHIPFEKFEQALSEIARVARTGAVISLPHFGPPIKLSFKIPLVPEVKVAWKIPFPARHVFNGEHYWEIGKRGYPIGCIRDVLRSHFVLENDFVPFESQYHHFFILRKS
jgi:SAM-dependent methyltransferase